MLKTKFLLIYLFYVKINNLSNFIAQSIPKNQSLLNFQLKRIFLLKIIKSIKYL